MQNRAPDDKFSGGGASRLQRLAEAAIIASLYAAITQIPGVNVISYGPLQFRVSEALTILPILTPAAIPGLTIGCVIANGLGVLTGVNIAGWWDVLFGSLATLMAAACTYWLRNIKIGKAPVPALLPPVIFNGLIIGAELSLVLPGLNFWAAAGYVAFGELVVCFALGLPLYFMLCRVNWPRR
ncbi:MAG: QueT transporter family protein [Oscillospiraceae bacterium]|nr:QueT transporter family protein [Oscillospiraceae bacterium]